MKVLVTGGAGFLGSHVVEELLRRNIEVTVVFDRVKPGNIAHIEDQIEWIHSDIRNMQSCQKAVKDVDALIHLAALINVDHSRRVPEDFYEINVKGTMNLLIAAKEEKQLRKFVYMGTCEVYGNVPISQADEIWPCEPRSPYGASKYGGERYCLGFQHTYKNPEEITIIRGFNLYGPRQKIGARGAVIPIFINKILHGSPPIIFGDGTQSRDYTYVQDTARAVVKATLTSGLNGEIINACSGREITINEVTKRLIAISGKKMKVIYSDGRPGEIVRSVGDNRKAKRLLHWSPETSFDEGLRRTFQYFQRTQPLNIRDI